ncbi:MAG TPA: hypothetical protein DCL43_08585 [Chitinophagaceae bacterium]|nr:hypothetical protein [Chitinophagaceae bacterium]HAN39972.1 hypothetical protein [Chitinophagaceae bacterium]
MLLLSICLSYSNLCIAQMYNFGMRLGNSSSEQIAALSAVDANGDLITGGLFTGSNFDLDPSSATRNISSSGDYDMYVAKYGANGAFIWGFSLGSWNSDGLLNIATDDSSNVYITGWFRGTVDFNPSPTATFNLTSNGEQGDIFFGGDAFLAKYSPSGTLIWAISLGSFSIKDYGTRIAFTPEGDIIWGGVFAGTVDFNPHPSQSNLLTANGTSACYFAKYNRNGQFIWARQLGGSNVDVDLRGLSVTSTGSIYIQGHYDRSIDLNPHPDSVRQIQTAGCGDIFVVKLNAAGQYQWGFGLGSGQCEYSWDNTIDENDNLIITGHIRGSVDFDPSPTRQVVRSVQFGSVDFYVAKYDTSGGLLYANVFGSNGTDDAYDVSHKNGITYVTGYFSGTVDFNPDPIVVNNMTSTDNQDIFVLALKNDGTYAASFRLGNTGRQLGKSIVLPNESALSFVDQASIFLVGEYDNTFDLDPGTGVATVTSSAGRVSAFIANYSMATILNGNILSFEGLSQNDANVIKWKIESLESNSTFILEKSTDNIKYEQLTSITKLENHFVDKSILVNKNYYYRIKILLPDGRTRYSKTVLIVRRKSNENFTLYPNPVKSNSELFLSFKNANTVREATVLLYDNLGRLVLKEILNTQTSNASVRLPSLATGIYKIVLLGSFGEAIAQKQLVIQ